VSVLVSYGSKSENVKLPTVGELFPFLRSEVLLSLNSFVISAHAAAKILRPYKPAAYHINELSKQIEFSIPDIKNINWIEGQSLTINFKKYGLCKPEMENATIREFIITDYFLNLYVKSLEAGDTAGSLKHLYGLMGAMCRPMDYQSITDPRTRIKSRQQAQVYGAIFERYSHAMYYRRRIIDIATICLYTAISTKNFINTNYMPHLGGGDGPATGPSFGWDTIVMDVAENGAFGKISEVYDTGLHDIMIFCVKKSMDFAKQQSQLNNTSKT
jgi:hypothetical protein